MRCLFSAVWDLEAAHLLGKDWLGQCDSFCHQQTRIQFRWLCTNGQGWGYKDGVGLPARTGVGDMNVTKVPMKPLECRSLGRCQWRKNLARGRVLLPEKLEVG